MKLKRLSGIIMAGVIAFSTSIVSVNADTGNSLQDVVSVKLIESNNDYKKYEIINKENGDIEYLTEKESGNMYIATDSENNNYYIEKEDNVIEVKDENNKVIDTIDLMDRSNNNIEVNKPSTKATAWKYVGTSKSSINSDVGKVSLLVGVIASVAGLKPAESVVVTIASYAISNKIKNLWYIKKTYKRTYDVGGVAGIGKEMKLVTSFYKVSNYTGLIKTTTSITKY